VETLAVWPEKLTKRVASVSQKTKQKKNKKKQNLKQKKAKPIYINSNSSYISSTLAGVWASVRGAPELGWA